MWREPAKSDSGPGAAPVLADLWQPTDPAGRSGLGLVYLHGSGWHYADKDFSGGALSHRLYSATELAGLLAGRGFRLVATRATISSLRGSHP